jgi:hypothetical protein
MNLRFSFFLCFYLLLFGNFKLFAQADSSQKFTLNLEYQAYGGAILFHHDNMKIIGNHPYVGHDLRLGWQTTGTEYWQQVFKKPKFGLGLYSGDFNNPVIGKPFAVFTFIEFPFVRNKNYHLSSSLASGLTFHLNEYNAESNPDNIAIGTDLNVFIEYSFLFKYKISHRFEIGSGIKFQHFSNGAMQHPNLGLNMISGQLAVNYYLQEPVKKELGLLSKPEVKKYEWNVMYGLGKNGKNQREPDVRYYNHSLSMSVSKRMNFKRNLGVGLDVFYNQDLKDEYSEGTTITSSDLISYAGFLSSDLIVNKFRMAFQLGFYLYRPVDYSIPFYERVAMRYYVMPNLFANVSIKAHAAKAQFIEWGIGLAF